MIGKLILFMIGLVIFATLTGVDFSPMYAQLAHIRDTATPYVDNIAEKSLQYASDVHLQEKVQPYINQIGNGTHG